MAIFGYARVSRCDQAVENQRLEIEKAGFKPDYWFCDQGISGSSAAAQRPQFRAMLAQIRDGEQIVVTKLDRLGRDALDVATTIRELGKRKIGVVVIQFGKLDLTSTAGRMMLTMLGAVAEMARDLLIERTRAGLDRAKAEGKALGRPPRLSPKDQQQVIELRHGGMSIRGLSRHFKVSRQTVSRVIDGTEGSATPKEAAAESAQQPFVDATPKASKRARKAVEKPAAALMADDMTERMTLEQKHGQRRLPAV